jgi:uncharacterized protein (TIGR03083 family)
MPNGSETDVIETDAIEAVAADRAALLELCDGLTEELWQAPSGCAGWRVQDVVTHMANLFWLVVDPARLPDLSGLPTEQAQEAAVRARAGISGAEALADYAEVSKPALDKLAEIAVLDIELPLGDLGTYPAAVLPSAYSFDHYTHIREDLFPPRGPLPGEPPPSDELRVGSALDWIAAALPQQNAAAAGECRLEIEVTGTGARSISFGHGRPKATIRSDGAGLVRWITQRGTWEEVGAQADGDAAALAVGRTLKVF